MSDPIQANRAAPSDATLSDPAQTDRDAPSPKASLPGAAFEGGAGESPTGPTRARPEAARAQHGKGRKAKGQHRAKRIRANESRETNPAKRTAAAPSDAGQADPFDTWIKENAIDQFIDMLRHRRPSRSKAAARFGRKFLEPVFGRPDRDGNYFLRVGDPGHGVMFAAHYDTVHSRGGTQEVLIDGNFARLPDKTESNCLGADCTAGIWLILQMIEAGVSGTYAIFADEEIGCVGSSEFARKPGDRLDDVQAIISFDRKGYDSVVTHQMGLRTASDEFAESLSAALGGGFKADRGGSYTDSNEFADFVPECANLSVGYAKQHTRHEVQDLTFLARLRDWLLDADFSRVDIARNPAAQEWDDFLTDYDSPARWAAQDWSGGGFDQITAASLVSAYPDLTADLLWECGFGEADLLGYIEGRLGRPAIRR